MPPKKVTQPKKSLHSIPSQQRASQTLEPKLQALYDTAPSSNGPKQQAEKFAQFERFVQDKKFTLYEEFVQAEKLNEKLKFVKNARDLITDAISTGALSMKEDVLLKLICHNYLLILSENIKQITPKDIVMLAKIGAGKLTPNNEKIFGIISLAREAAAKLELGGGKHDECENVLTTISKVFPVQGPQEVKQQYFLNNIKQGFLEPAKILFDSIGPLTPPEQTALLSQVFRHSVCRDDIQYLRRVVDKFKIDVKSLSFINGAETYSALSCTITLKDIHTKAQYLNFLKKKGMGFDSEKDRPDFQQMHGKTLLIRACGQGDQELVELLLSFGADINQSFEHTNPDGVVLISCPFGASFSSMNIEFVKYLITKGADPIQMIESHVRANSPTQEDTVQKDDTYEKYKISSGGYEISSGGKEFYDIYFPKVAIAENPTFVTQYCSLIEEYIKERLVTLVIEIEEVPTDHCVTVEKHPVKSSKPTKKVISETTTSPQEEIPKLLSMYIDFKEATQEKAADIENEFDILLLKFCQTGSEEELLAVHNYISENPELNHYAITSILETAKPVAVAQDVFMYQPKLLHRFFELKKQFGDAPSKEKTTAFEGGYKVKSNLKHDVYVDISPKLKSILETNYQDFYKKLKHAITDCTFIKADSKDISGLKTYNGIIKFKIAKEDFAIMTHTKYLDKSTGNIFIIFDQLIDHKAKPKGDLQTVEVDNFTQIWEQLGFDSESQYLVPVEQLAAIGEIPLSND